MIGINHYKTIPTPGPDSPAYIPSLERRECGLSRSPVQRGRRTARILGGDDTALGEFPFLALLGNSRSNDTIFWHCGGSIINQWYVLSAAQCGRSNTPDYVRLGEWKLEDDPKYKTDCETVEGVRSCTQPYQVGLYIL